MAFKKKYKIFILLFIFLSLIFYCFQDDKNLFSIILSNNNISCLYNLKISFSQTFIDLLYFNNQAEVNYNILLLKKISTPLLSQDQKIVEKKIQYFLSYKNNEKMFTLYSSFDYYESNSITKILEKINTMKFNNLFSLEKPGTYFCVSNIYINSLTPINPALFFLFLFYNPYNMKILNLISNTITYEVKN